MKTQNYTNHRKLDPIYHGIIVMCCVLGSVILIISLIKLLLVNAALLENFPWFMKTIYIGVFLIAIGLIFMTFRLRQYSLQNQDRIISLEE